MIIKHKLGWFGCEALKKQDPEINDKFLSYLEYKDGALEQVFENGNRNLLHWWSEEQINRTIDEGNWVVIDKAPW